MKLGFVSAILPDLSLEEVVSFASASGTSSPIGCGNSLVLHFGGRFFNSKSSSAIRSISPPACPDKSAAAASFLVTARTFLIALSTRLELLMTWSPGISWGSGAIHTRGPARLDSHRNVI